MASRIKSVAALIVRREAKGSSNTTINLAVAREVLSKVGAVAKNRVRGAPASI